MGKPEALNSHFTRLNPQHELFNKLKESNPPWWRFVKNEIQLGEFYVDIRKNNSLNIYYNGASLLKVTLSRGNIKGEIHEYYLNQIGSKYVRYELSRLPKEADDIKKRIGLRYSDTSENGIKAKLICNPNANYIDSEFAYPEAIGKKIDKYGKEVTAYNTTRIDLTKLENEKIVFVELKRIEDNRLLNNKYENGSPEILSQMKAYHLFIAKYKQEITSYYKTLFKIKHKLGVLPQSMSKIENIDNYELSNQVELYIEPYLHLNPRRVQRINAIRTILDKNHITHNL